MYWLSGSLVGGGRCITKERFSALSEALAKVENDFRFEIATIEMMKKALETIFVLITT